VIAPANRHSHERGMPNSIAAQQLARLLEMSVISAL
jgi:hypothetical protein